MSASSGRWRAASCSARLRCRSPTPGPTRRRSGRRPSRDGDGYVLNGTKAWVTQGDEAGVILAMARTDTPDHRRGARGISAFIVTPDLPGFRVGKKEDKMGLRASPTVQLVFDNLRVPADRLLGEAGRASFTRMQSLEHGRLGIAAQAVGIAPGRARARGAVRRRAPTVRQARSTSSRRSSSSSPTWPRASRRRGRLLFAAAAAKDRGEPITQLSSMAKLVASETAMWVTTQAIQVFGGYGYVTDYPVERLFRDAKVTEIYEGTSEIQRLVIARELYAA